MFCIERQFFFVSLLNQFSEPLFLCKTVRRCSTDFSYAVTNFFFLNNGVQISLNNKTFSSASFLLNFISTINRCPILSLWDRFLMIELNFYRQGVSFYFLCNHRWEVLSLHFHNDCFCPFKYFRDDSFCFGFPIIFYVIDNF